MSEINGQNDLDLAPPPPPPPKLLYRDRWRSLNDAEQSLILDAKAQLASHQYDSDSLLHKLTDYLRGNKYLAIYQAKEVGLLINQIPTKEAHEFIWSNIDFRAKMRTSFDKSRSFTFFYILLDHNHRTMDYSFLVMLKSGFLNDCDINGRALHLIRSYLRKEFDYKEEKVAKYLSDAIELVDDQCAKLNLERIISKYYPNEKYSKTIR